MTFGHIHMLICQIHGATIAWPFISKNRCSLGKKLKKFHSPAAKGDDLSGGSLITFLLLSATIIFHLPLPCPLLMSHYLILLWSPFILLFLQHTPNIFILYLSI
jgi:hypothetical protein